MLPKAEIKRYDPEVENEYNELGARLGELRAEIVQVNSEIDQIMKGLGELVGSGKPYKKQTARLAALRLESEALEAGARYVDGQKGLLKRVHNWLRTR